MKSVAGGGGGVGVGWGDWVVAKPPLSVLVDVQGAAPGAPRASCLTPESYYEDTCGLNLLIGSDLYNN